MQLLFSTEAEADLIDSANYLNSEQPHLGSEFLDKVQYTSNLLLNMPKMGTPIKSLIDGDDISEEIINAFDLLKEVRRFPVPKFRKHIVFYKTENDTLKVIRVLHASRDIPTIFATISAPL